MVKVNDKLKAAMEEMKKRMKRDTLNMDDLLMALATIRLGDNERDSDFILRYNTLVDQLLRLGEVTSNVRKVHTL